MQKILKNTAWLTGGEIIGRLLRSAIVIYAARLLGASDWGVFSYLLSLSALFTVISDIGLGAVLTREMVKYPDQRFQYLSTSLFIKILLLIIIAVGIIFSSPYFTKITLPTFLIYMAALLTIFDSLRSFGFSIIRSLEKMHLEATINVLTQLLIAGIGFWALYTYGTLKALALSYVIGSASGFLIAIFILRHWLVKIDFSFNPQLAKKIITTAWPFALLGLLGGIMLNTDIIMLGWFRDATEIGYYSAAQKIIFVLYVLPSIIAAASFPSLTRFAQKQITSPESPSSSDFSKLLVSNLKIVFIIALPIAFGGIIVGQPLINLIFGTSYIQAALPFQILLISLLINYPATIIGNGLFAFDKQKEFIKFSALGAISNVVINLLLIPYYGIAGAAVSTVFTQLISNIFIWRKMNQTNPFSLKNQLNKIIIATLIMSAVVLTAQFLNMQVIITIAIAIIVYGFSLYLLKEPALNNLKILLK